MKTTEEIYAALKENFESASGLALNDGGDMALRFMALAAQLESLYYEADFVATQGMPQTASGGNLDYFASLKGLSRVPAKKATGKITFYGADGVTTTIEKGTRCLGNNGMEYVTTEEKRLTAASGSCTVAAEATVAGDAGCIAIGGIVTMMLPPVGVKSCKNTVPFFGGKDAESDEELRKRVLMSYKTVINGGNKEYYRQLAMSVDSIVAAQVIPKERGAGTVDVIVSTHEYMPASATVAEVQTLMDENREVCTDVLVRRPQTVPIGVAATVTAKAGQSQKLICDNVKIELQKYFVGERLGRDVLRSELEEIIASVSGVASYVLTQPEEDFLIDPNELPVIGAITVTGGEA